MRMSSPTSAVLDLRILTIQNAVELHVMSTHFKAWEALVQATTGLELEASCLVCSAGTFARVRKTSCVPGSTRWQERSQKAC